LLIIYSGQKRKRDEELVDGNSGKRSRSIQSQSNVADAEITVDAEKRKPVITVFKKSSLTVWQAVRLRLTATGSTVA
jgi:hypothetical protein